MVISYIMCDSCGEMIKTENPKQTRVILHEQNWFFNGSDTDICQNCLRKEKTDESRRCFPRAP